MMRVVPGDPGEIEVTVALDISGFETARVRITAFANAGLAKFYVELMEPFRLGNPSAEQPAHDDVQNFLACRCPAFIDKPPILHPSYFRGVPPAPTLPEIMRDFDPMRQ